MITQDLAKAEGLRACVCRGERVPEVEQLWALDRLCELLAACRDALSAEKREFGASPDGDEEGSA